MLHDRPSEPGIGSSHFGRVAGSYARGRPTASRETADFVFEHVKQNPDVLEVGAGTGQLTRRLVRRSRTLVCLEPDERLRGMLREAVPATGVEVRPEPFEEFEPAARFDLIVASGVWHWLDAGRAVGGVERCLRDRGRLALVWNYTDLEGPERALARDQAFAGAFARFKGTGRRVRRVADRCLLDLVGGGGLRLVGSRLSTQVALVDPAAYQDLVRSFGCAKNYSVEQMDRLGARLDAAFAGAGLGRLRLATTTRVDVFAVI
jgi:SAM-dependent methyltransferase